MSAVPTIDLNDGHTIPQLGFGVFQIDPDETAQAVTTALEIGYRHIDTAEMDRNEKGVGEGVRSSGLDREGVFVTSKLNNGFHRPDDARKAFEGTLEALGFDYVDLFLIHWPLPTLYDGDYVSTWKALEAFKQDGRARSIGVSNFQVAHLEDVRQVQVAAQRRVVVVAAERQLQTGAQAAEPYLGVAEICADHPERELRVGLLLAPHPRRVPRRPPPPQRGAPPPSSMLAPGPRPAWSGRPPVRARAGRRAAAPAPSRDRGSPRRCD
jgi:diketogulonate reductase-like aldo/keto reductase